MSHLQSDHEEMDTKTILHALDAAADSATEPFPSILQTQMF